MVRTAIRTFTFGDRARYAHEPSSGAGQHAPSQLPGRLVLKGLFSQRPDSHSSVAAVLLGLFKSDDEMPPYVLARLETSFAASLRPLAESTSIDCLKSSRSPSGTFSANKQSSVLR